MEILLYCSNYYWIDLINKNHKNILITNDIKNVKNTKLKILIPMMEIDMLNVSKNSKNLNIKIIMPKIETIELFQNKNLFNDYIKKLKSSFEYLPIPNDTYDINYKGLYILKPYKLNAGSGMKIINKYEIIDKYITQEYIENIKEYTTHLLCKDGEILFQCTYEFINNKPYYIKLGLKNKDIELSNKIELQNEYLNIFKIILNDVKYNGLCNIDFKINNNKEIKIFEINPRIGGSIFYKKNTNDFIELLKVIQSNF
jgi:carbamoylphosphate synthase large subunit